MMGERHERDLSTADVAAAGRRDVDDVRGGAEQPLHDREIQTTPAIEHDAERTGGEAQMPLLSPDIVSGFRRQWVEVQTGFVDEPRRAVEQADELVAEAVRQIAQSFADARATLERQWDRGDDVSTEDLRQALQRYRAFFGRLLSV